MYMCAYGCLYTNEMKVRNATKDWREEIGLFCYYKALTLSVKWCGAFPTWTWMNYKCTLRILGQPLKKVKNEV